MVKNSIVLIGTFWNEIEWIKYSLQQIQKINPREVILCDGCFDNNVSPINSTDGTSKALNDFAKDNPCVKIVSPKRVDSRLVAFFLLFKGHNKTKWYQYFSLSRFFSSLRGSLKNFYRINQAITFNHMISLIDQWEENSWFMFYDADQFYSDEMISNFRNLDEFENYDLLTGVEKTFSYSIDDYTTEYEKRDYNNMPRKIKSNLVVYPTRDIFLESFLTRKKYESVAVSKNVGFYSHFKVRSEKRFNETYSVGDRKMPNFSQFNYSKEKTESHPSLIRLHLTELRNKFNK